MRNRITLIAALTLTISIGWSPAASVAAGPGDGKPRRQHRLPEQPAPKLGEAAPVFKLKTLERTGEVDLAGFAGKRPVLLLFGSYT